MNALFYSYCRDDLTNGISTVQYPILTVLEPGELKCLFSNF